MRFRYGKLRINKALQVLIGVNCYDTYNVLELGYRDRLDEGVLQITAITEAKDKTVKQLLSNVSMKKTQGMYQWKTTSFNLSNKHKKIVAGVDGEREEYTTPVTIHILPKVLRVYVPPEGVRGRPKDSFSFPVVRQVWKLMTNK